MSDVIRNAVIKLGIQLATPNLKLPDVGPAVQAQTALNEAVKASTTANQAAASAAEKLAAADTHATTSAATLAHAQHQQTAAFEKAGHAALGLARGVAYVAAGQSDALSEMLPYLFVLEGSLGIVKSAEKLNKALAVAYGVEAGASVTAAIATQGLGVAFKALYAAMGPVGWIILAITAAVYVLSKAYDALVPSAEETNAELEKQRQIMADVDASVRVLAEAFKIIGDAQLEHIELLDSEKEKSIALIKAMNDPVLNSEQRLQAARKELSVIDNMRQAFEKQKHNAIELIRLRERELKTAQEALKSEQDKEQALRASVGALNAGDKKRLEKLTSKVEGGGTLSQKEALDLQKLGGNAGQKIAEKFLAELDKGNLGQRLDKLTGDPVAKAQAEFERRQQSFNQVTGGKSAEEAIKAQSEFTDAMVASIDAAKGVIVDKIHELIDAVAQEKIETNRQQAAQQAARATQ